MKLTEIKNPLKADKIDVLSPSDWLGSIGFVAWLGFVVALGAKTLIAADKVLPGNNTPAGYKKAVEVPSVSNGVTVL